MDEGSESANCPMQEDDLLFVYGTLRRGARCVMARWLAGQADFIGSGVIPGRLYDVGSYPALRSARYAGEMVVGDLYRLSRPGFALARLDRYEGIGPGQSRPNQYSRERVLVTLEDGGTHQAWTYLYRGETARLRQIRSGDYLQDGGPNQSRQVKVRRGIR